MERAQKIALIGAKGFNSRSDDRVVSSVGWSDLDRLGNLRDYDVVVLNVWTGKPEGVDWNGFHNLLDLNKMREILMPGGRIYVVGDPRFDIDVVADGTDQSRPFLSWSGLKFHWDEEAGDTINLRSGYSYKRYETYLNSLRRWPYSLRRVEIDEEGLWEVFNQDFFEKQGYEVEVVLDGLASNRYGCALAARLHIVVQLSSKRYSTASGPVAEFGPIIWLPATTMREEDALTLVLGDLCGVEAEAPEPE